MKEPENPWEIYYRTSRANWKGSPYELPGLPEGGRVLDIGCGTGSTLVRCLNRGWTVTGMDISASAIERTEKRLRDRGLECTLLVGDITGIDDIGPFDLILCHYVLGALNIKSRKKASENIMKMMGERSILSFEDLAVGDVREGRGENFEENSYLKGNGIMQHFFTEDEVQDLFFKLETTGIGTDEWMQGKMTRRRVLGKLVHP